MHGGSANCQQYKCTGNGEVEKIKWEKIYARRVFFLGGGADSILLIEDFIAGFINKSMS
jgi:hypothetical protein